MIADALDRLGIPPTIAKAIVALFLIMVGGLVSALAAGWPGTPAVIAFLLGVAYLIDPNAGHATNDANAVG
jgi:hypothetical protein